MRAFSPVLLARFGASLAAAQMSPLRYPSVRGGQIRIEGYLVPRVTSWPQYPAWSPEGREIAFSLDGRIWAVPAGGGEAVQVTTGAGYDFEPDWSPDGEHIAFSRDVSGNLDVYVVARAGGEERRLTYHPALELHPRWTRDGAIVYASASAGNFDLHRIDPGGRDGRAAFDWPTNEIQPDPSPVSDEIAFVSTRSGKVGTGGIFVGDEEIHFEETSFLARPAFSPDGSTIAYVSDVGGSRGIWLLPGEGGVPVPLTREAEVDAFSPAWSHDGENVVYATRRQGRGVLEVQPVYGGSPRVVAIERRRYPDSLSVGRLSVSLSQPSRVSILGSDGRYHAPPNAFRRIVSFTEVHYFHASGSFVLDVPSGATTLRVARGPEYEPVETTVDVPSGGRTSARIQMDASPICPPRVSTRATPTCTTSTAGTSG